MQSERGKIRNHQRARQQRDYSALRYDNITPTDIDGLIEYHDKAYVIFELKYERAPLSMGQQLALERLTDDLTKVKPTLCVMATHDTRNPDRDIPADKTVVLQYRQNRVWYKPNQTRTLKNIIDDFLLEIDERVGC